MPDLIPIAIKKPFARPTFPGRATIEKVQHAAQEQGRFMDRSVGDAMLAIKEAQKQLLQRIENYTNMNKLATTSKLPDSARPLKLIKDILDFIKKIKEFIDEVMELIKAIRDLIGFIISLKQQMQAWIQARINSIATLINQICNFQLPDLPAIPNIFNTFHFDGFQFPSGAFKFSLSFDANFAFSTCKFRKPNLDIFRNYPRRGGAGNGGSGAGTGGNQGGPTPTPPPGGWTATNPPPPTGGNIPGPVPSIPGTGGSSIPLQPTPFPPIPGALVADPAQFTVPEYKAMIAASPKLFLAPDFTPNGNYFGALPVPGMIISNYSLPPDVLQDQVLSLLGGSEAIIADMNPAGTINSPSTSTATIPPPSAGTLDNTRDVEHHREALQPTVRRFSVQKVTLGNIVDSDWDWAVVYAWLTYIHQARAARKGEWLPAFQTIYTSILEPGYADIANASIPWHSSPDDASQVKAGPETPFLFTRTLTSLDPAGLKAALWRLSYVEASLLDYPRNTRWDPAAEAHYVDGVTRADLDYFPIARAGQPNTVVIFLDSKGKANYPSDIAVPDDLLANVQAVINKGLASIFSVKTYQSPRASARYVFDMHAETIEMNYHSQFWREFSMRWDELQQEDADLQNIVYNYPEILNSYLNPLATLDPFNAAKTDFLDRDRGWVRGTPYLKTPFIPTLILPPMGLMLPVGAPNGWGGVMPGIDEHGTVVGGGKAYDENDNPIGSGNLDAQGNPVPLVFDPAVFLARPDIKGLSPNAQEMLLFLNKAAAHTADIGAKIQAKLDQTIAEGEESIGICEAAISNMAASGYIVPDGAPGFLGLQFQGGSTGP